MVYGWLHTVQGLIFPPSCILCGDRGQAPVLDMCAPCVADLTANTNPCRGCASPLSGGEDIGLLCGDCLGRRRPFDQAVAPFLYDYPLDRLIHAFKYGGVLAYGRVLGTLVAEHLRKRTEMFPEVLLPVPLHPSRQRERGFNQAVELGRPLSQLLGIPLDDRLCRRIRATEEQTELSAKERRQNVRGAFVLTRKPEHGHVALLDDVLTTGSTAGEVAQLLKQAGVKRVEVWTIARALARATHEKK